VSLPSFDSSVNNCLVLSAQGPNPQSFRRPSVWPFALALAHCGFRENEDASIRLPLCYQIWTRSSGGRTMGLPSGTSKAWANSGKLLKGPLTRNFPGLCGSICDPSLQDGRGTACTRYRPRSAAELMAFLR
jgi:hypothetical protein